MNASVKITTTKNLFTRKEAEVFISFLDNDIDKTIAKLIFIDGLKNEEIADALSYSLRHTERLRANLVNQVIVKLINLRTPKRVIPFKRTAHDFDTGICPHSHYPCEHIKKFNHEYDYTDYKCPTCGKRVSDGTPNCCCHCSQVLDWE